MKYQGPHLEILHERYGRALFEVSEEAGKLKEVFNAIDLLNKSLREDEAFLKILGDPEIDKSSKLELFKTLAERFAFPEELLSFLRLLVKNNRIALIHGIFLKYRDLYDRKKGEVKVFVKTAKPLDKKIVERLKKVLNKVLKKGITVIEKYEPSLVGGMDIKVGGVVYKSSIVNKLKLMKEGMLQ